MKTFLSGLLAMSLVMGAASPAFAAAKKSGNRSSSSGKKGGSHRKGSTTHKPRTKKT